MTDAVNVDELLAAQKMIADALAAAGVEAPAEATFAGGTETAEPSEEATFAGGTDHALSHVGEGIVSDLEKLPSLAKDVAEGAKDVPAIASDVTAKVNEIHSMVSEIHAAIEEVKPALTGVVEFLNKGGNPLSLLTGGLKL